MRRARLAAGRRHGTVGERGTRAGRWLLLALLLSALAWPRPALVAAQELPLADDRELLFGVAAHGWWLEDHLDAFVAAYRDLGVTTVRLSIDWKYIEPAPGVYRWERYDQVLGRLVDEHITVVGVFVTVPAWAASDPAACAVEETEPRGCDLPAARAEAFERVARATLTRYPFIRHWEFWNEPELWDRIGHDVGDYLPWLTRFYAIAKATDPAIQVAAGTLAGWEYVGWMYDVSETMLGPGVRPWDAVAFHPYNIRQEHDANGAVLSLWVRGIEELRAGMVARGDGHKPIWITEYGWEEPPEAQAAQLRAAMDWLLGRDYIAMAHLHMLHDWHKEHFGLLRAVPEVYGSGPVTPATRFVPKEPYYSAFRTLPRPPLPPLREGAGSAATGHLVAVELRPRWEADRLLLGDPLTRAFWVRRAAGDFALVQYFAGGRLEWTPAGGVAAGLLGDEALQRRGWLDGWGQPAVATPAAPATAAAPPDALYCSETGHALAGAFRAAWEAAGGLPALGYPRTDVLTETAPESTPLLVQYTQRGRLEWAPTPEGAESVRPAHSGREALQAYGWLDAEGRPAPGYLNPARRAFQ